MTIGSNIKKLRTGQGLTQDQLAERLYVTRQTVSNWERGASQPDLEQLEAIAAALGVEVMTLLYGPKGGPGRKRIAIALALLLSGCILCLVGVQWVAPWLDQGFKYGEISLWLLYVYRLCYWPLVVVLLSTGVLALASLVWDISLGGRARRVCLVTGILLSVCPILLVCFFFLLYSNAQPPHGVYMAMYYYMLRGWNRGLAAFIGTAFFLAFNPPRRKKEEIS